MRLQDQVALVTGASHGLGLAIAGALAAEGAAVGCMARAGAQLDAAVAGLRAGGADAFAVPADVTDSEQVNRAIAQLLTSRRRLDVLVLNAGAWKGAKLAETSDADWDLLIDLNLKGAFLPLRATIPAMQAAKRGTVVGIGALGGLVGYPGSGAYAASKWGMRGLLASAALELGEHGIRVSHVHPQNMNSAGREIAPDSPDRLKNLEPAEVAALVVFIVTSPAHVRVGDATIWPIASGIGPR